jgi:hypothetical protein
MAKKDVAPEAPVVTTLPLPNSDNAMVIDLPDGQKLVVGKMETGTVIEVATWRGTGRPDSRTTRLMLGVSSQEKVTEVNAQSSAPQKVSKVPALDSARSAAVSFAKSLAGKLSLVAAKAKKIKVEKPSTSPTLAAPVATTAVSKDTDTEVQAWLDSIIAKSEKKEAAQATIKPSTSVKKAAPKSAPAKKSTAKKASTTRRAR